MHSVDTFLTALKQILAPSQILTDPDELQFYAQDWSKTLTPKASAAVFPRTTLEVQAILKLAKKYKIQIVPSGGRTGLSGGAVATQGEVVLSLRDLNFIGEFSETALTLHVGAGVITETVHEYTKKYGLTWPVDFASKGSSTVGGNLATNAGGIRVIRYGNTREWVLGITAVTADGTLLELNHDLEKNNTGYDFRQLLIGSEGTLAVITEATLKLCPLPRSTLVFLFSIQDFSKLIELFQFARKSFPHLSAFECLDLKSYETVLTHFNKTSPVNQTGAKVFAVMELENTTYEEAQHGLALIFDHNLCLDGVLAKSDAEARSIWQIREGVAESILHEHLVHQQDVSVPVSKLESFYSEIVTRYDEAYPDSRVFFFGHIGDGNLHIFIQKPKTANEEAFIKKSKSTDLELFETLKKYSGSVSAEHGIGLLKKHALHFTRSEAEISLMRLVKTSFDPDHLLNPGKTLPFEF